MPLDHVWVYRCAGCDREGPTIPGHKPPHDPKELDPAYGYSDWRFSQKKNHQCPECVAYYTRIYGED